MDKGTTKLIIAAAVAVVTYLLFRQQINAWFQQMTGTAEPAQPATGNAQQQQTIATAQTTRALMQAWADKNAFYQQQNKLMSGWQWAAGYKAVRGTDAPGPDLLWPGQDQSRLLSLDEWLSAAVAYGLSGVPAPPKKQAAIPAPPTTSRAVSAWTN